MMDNNYKIYMHKNKINNKVYIGMTKLDVKKRWANGKGYISNKKFYSDIVKYKWDNFEHIILFSNLEKKEAEQKEIELIKKYKSNFKKYGYNVSKGNFNKNENKDTIKINISIPNDLKNDLKKLANKKYLNLSSYIRYKLTEIVLQERKKE